MLSSKNVKGENVQQLLSTLLILVIQIKLHILDVIQKS